jgi:DNA-directed RNA polymerase specialized sigma24 family protein
MRSPEEFDAFYARERDQLLVETYALTGDLPAARTAVRDAFSAAWHHWDKVARHDDPAAWTRPLAHGRAQRRRTARIWHREHVDAEVSATLEALAALSSHERKVLVLSHLSPLPMAEVARTVGVPRDAAERDLQSATAAFALARDLPTTGIRAELDRLREVTADARWPRATIVRRAGTARRRTHTLVGVGAAVGALLLSGTLVASGVASPTSLRMEQEKIGAVLRPTEPPEPPSLTEGRLLRAAQVERVAPRLRWSTARTTTNLRGDGLVVPCQAERFADPEGVDALVRSHRGRDGKGRKARVVARTTELVELSADPRAARRAYRTARSWYAGCEAPRTRLLSTHEVAGVGQQADLLVLRQWGDRPGTLVVALARTGRLTVTTVAQLAGDVATGAATGTASRTLSAAVNALCGGAGADVCAGPPRTRGVPPLPTGEAPGMLAALDLPPVRGATGPWVGTEPLPARDNVAATRCDNTQFTGPGVDRARTRTFLFPAQRGASEFGITQTVGAMPEPDARRFLAGVRRRIASCADADLGTNVAKVVDERRGSTELTAWDLDVEISDEESVEFMMAILRDGTAVSQIGFVPGGSLDLTRQDFVAVTRRALERLDHLPEPRRERR